MDPDDVRNEVVVDLFFRKKKMKSCSKLDRVFVFLSVHLGFGLLFLP